MKEAIIEELCETVNNLGKKIDGFSREAFQKPVYTNAEVMKMFNVSSATLKKWRLDGLLSFSQPNSTYLYSAKDIETFMERTHMDFYY